MEPYICPAWSGATNLHSKEGRVACTSEKKWPRSGHKYIGSRPVIRVQNISPDAVLCSCSVVRVVTWRDRAILASWTRSQRASWSCIDWFSPWLMGCWYFAVQSARAWEAPAMKVWSHCVTTSREEATRDRMSSVAAS